jgi:hypothetical protein
MTRLGLIVLVFVGCSPAADRDVDAGVGGVDAGALVDAGPERCGSASRPLPEGLITLAHDDDSVAVRPKNALGISFMSQPYGSDGPAQGPLPSTLPSWEAVRFDLQHPARIVGASVRWSMLRRQIPVDEPVTLGLYADFGLNGFDFDRSAALVEGGRCAGEIDEGEWVTYTFPEAVRVDHPGPIYIAHMRQPDDGPLWAFDATKSEDCGPFDTCHSAWNFPDLERGFFDGLSLGIPFDYTVRLHLEYVDQKADGSDLFEPASEQRFGSRVAFGDFDNDGWDDLFSGGKLWHNDGNGALVDVTDGSGLGGGDGVWGDINNDGCLDLLTFGGRERLFEGDCAGSFAEVTELAGLDDFTDQVNCGEGGEQAPTMAAGWLDLNADGLLDIYSANGECWRDNRGHYYSDHIYRARPDGTYLDLAGFNGFRAERTYSRGLAIADGDGDGLTDVFLGNYRLQINRYFVNDGASRVVEQAEAAGLAGDPTGGAYGHTIGAAWGDLDNDGDLDMVHANLAHPRFYHFSDRSKVLINNGDNTFEDRIDTGFRYQETHSVPGLGDFDNDGDLDAVISAVYDGRPTDFYWGDGDGSFTLDAYRSGITVTNTWGTASSDLDGDGDLDLIIYDYYRNRRAHTGHWFSVRAVGDAGSNWAAIGATVRVTAGGTTRTRVVQGSSGQGCQDSMYLHFGLADAPAVEQVEVVFPGGEPVIYRGPWDADQRLWVYQSGAAQLSWGLPE